MPGRKNIKHVALKGVPDAKKEIPAEFISTRGGCFPGRRMRED
jgi:hypothetical protein